MFVMLGMLYIYMHTLFQSECVRSVCFGRGLRCPDLWCLTCV